MAARESAFWAANKASLKTYGDAAYARGEIPDWDAWRSKYDTPPTEGACRMKYIEMRKAAPEPEADPVALEEVRIARKRELQQDRAALKDVAGERSFRRYLEELVSDTAQAFRPVAFPSKAPPSRRQDTITETMIQSLSDWHAYEVVDAERVRGFNAYDADVFGRRVRAIVDRHLAIKTRMERGGGWHFPRLVIGANGDFVSGTIHEVERHGDAPSVVQAVYGCGLVLAQAIRDLAAAYPEVDVVCSSGNHGRLPDARKVQQKDPLRSWDTLIYYFARENLRAQKNVTWCIPNSYSVSFEAEGWRFLQTHGHDVRSWNQIPHYGINRMVSNVNALEASRGTPIHYFLFGHFHTKTSLEHALGEWFINGSLIGGTEFSVQGMGQSGKPTQWMLGVHRDYGVSHRWPLLARDEPNAPGYDVTPWRTEVAT